MMCTRSFRLYCRLNWNWCLSFILFEIHCAHSGFIAGSIETAALRAVSGRDTNAHSGFIAGSIETNKLYHRESVLSYSSFRLYCRLNWNRIIPSNRRCVFLLIPALLPAQLKQSLLPPRAGRSCKLIPALLPAQLKLPILFFFRTAKPCSSFRLYCRLNWN